MALDWRFKRETLLDYYPELASRLIEPNQIHAIWRDKWPVIDRYLTAKAMTPAGDSAPDWLDFKYSGKQTIARKDGQMVFVI